MPKKQNGYIDVWEVTKEFQGIVANHSRLMLDQYKIIKGVYGWPNRALMDTVEMLWPQGTSRFFEIFDMWLEDQLKFFVKNMEESFEEYADDISSIEYSAPDPEKYREMVAQHTRLWIENYQKIKERREEANQISLDSLKSMLPAMVHPILDNAYRWISAQNELVERQIMDQVKRYAHEND